MAETKARPQVVHVEWEDAASHGDGPWQDNDGEIKYEPEIIQQVGFLLADNEGGIVLTAGWNENQYFPPFQIPRGMIKKIKKIKI